MLAVVARDYMYVVRIGFHITTDRLKGGGIHEGREGRMQTSTKGWHGFATKSKRIEFFGLSFQFEHPWAKR